MTNDEINALPERVRRFIHDLETIADPAHMVQQIWSLREQVDGLAKLVRELKQKERSL